MIGTPRIAWILTTEARCFAGARSRRGTVASSRCAHSIILMWQYRSLRILWRSFGSQYQYNFPFTFEYVSSSRHKKFSLDVKFCHLLTTIDITNWYFQGFMSNHIILTMIKWQHIRIWLKRKKVHRNYLSRAIYLALLNFYCTELILITPTAQKLLQ